MNKFARVGLVLAMEEAKVKKPIDEKKIHKGKFHEWLGKDKDEPITDADIEKGLASDDPEVRKMANFAKNARKWKHKKAKVAAEAIAQEGITGGAAVGALVGLVGGGPAGIIPGAVIGSIAGCVDGGKDRELQKDITKPKTHRGIVNESAVIEGDLASSDKTSTLNTESLGKTTLTATGLSGGPTKEKTFTTEQPDKPEAKEIPAPAKAKANPSLEEITLTLEDLEEFELDGGSYLEEPEELEAGTSPINSETTPAVTDGNAPDANGNEPGHTVTFTNQQVMAHGKATITKLVTDLVNTPLNPDAPVEEDLTITGPVEDINPSEKSVAECMEALVSLESIANVLRKSVREGGVNRAGAEILAITTQDQFSKMGISTKNRMPALESFDSFGPRISSTQMALEGIVSGAKEILVKLWEWIKKAVEWIKGFFKKAEVQNAQTIARANEIKPFLDKLFEIERDITDKHFNSDAVFAEGRAAANNGKSVRSNPYIDGGEYHHSWHAGNDFGKAGSETVFGNKMKNAAPGYKDAQLNRDKLKKPLSEDEVNKTMDATTSGESISHEDAAGFEMNSDSISDPGLFSSLQIGGTLPNFATALRSYHSISDSVLKDNDAPIKHEAQTLVDSFEKGNFNNLSETFKLPRFTFKPMHPAHNDLDMSLPEGVIKIETDRMFGNVALAGIVPTSDLAGEQAIKALTAAKVFLEKDQAEGGHKATDLKILTKEECRAAFDTVMQISSCVTSVQDLALFSEDLKNKLIKANQRIIANGADDTQDANDENKHKEVNSIVAINRGIIKLLDQPGLSYVGYAIKTNNALLTYIEKSIQAMN